MFVNLWVQCQYEASEKQERCHHHQARLVSSREHEVLRADLTPSSEQTSPAADSLVIAPES